MFGSYARRRQQQVAFERLAIVQTHERAGRAGGEPDDATTR